MGLCPSLPKLRSANGRTPQLRIPGLQCGCSEHGGKTFVFFSVPGKRGSQRYTIGPFLKFKVKDAQRAAKILTGQLAVGKGDLNRDTAITCGS